MVCKNGYFRSSEKRMAGLEQPGKEPLKRNQWNCFWEGLLSLLF